MKRTVLLLAAGVWWWSRPPGVPAPDYDQISACGVILEPRRELLEAAMSQERCGQILEGMTSDPDWAMGITIAGSYVRDTVDTFAIQADGEVEYTSEGIARALLLSPEELASIRDLGRLDCVHPTTHDRLAIWIVPGPPVIRADASILSESALGTTLVRTLWRAVARRHEERLAELAPISLDVRAGKYRIELVGETMRVHHGGQVVHEQKFWGDELVDLVDHVAARPQDGGPTDEIAHGLLTAGGVVYPIRFGVQPGGVYEPLRRVLEDAAYDD